MTFNTDEVKDFSFSRLEKKEIPEDQRVVSIWRKKREAEDAVAAEQAALDAVKEAAEEAAAEKAAAAKGPKYPPAKAPEHKAPEHKAPEHKAPEHKAAASTAPAAEVPAGEAEAAEGEAAPETPPPPRLILRPRKPTRGSFKHMVSAEERPKGSFTGFATAEKPGPDGVRTHVLDSEREAEEAAEKTAAEKRAELMAQAQAEAAALKQRAREEGHTQGYTQGLAKAREEVRAELLPVLRKFVAETQELLNHRAEILRGAEREILELVLLIGRKVLHAELRLHPEVVAQVVRHALGRAIGWGRVKVLAHPEDCALLEEVKDAISAGLEGVTIVEFEPSPSLARGGCVLQSNLGEVDVRLELQMGEVEQALQEALGARLRGGEPAAPAPGKPAPPAAAAPPAPEPPVEKEPEVEAQPYRLRELGGPPPQGKPEKEGGA